MQCNRVKGVNIGASWFAMRNGGTSETDAGQEQVGTHTTPLDFGLIYCEEFSHIYTYFLR